MRHTFRVLMAIWSGLRIQMDLLDVPISMYDVVLNCRGLGPKPGYTRSVNVPVLPSNNILLSQPPSWTAQE